MQYSRYTLTPTNKRKSKYNIHDHQKFRPLESNQFSGRKKSRQILIHPSIPYYWDPILRARYLAYQHSDTITGISQPHTYFRGRNPVWSTVSNDLLLFPYQTPPRKYSIQHRTVFWYYIQRQSGQVMLDSLLGSGALEKKLDYLLFFRTHGCRGGYRRKIWLPIRIYFGNIVDSLFVYFNHTSTKRPNL